MRGFFMPHLFRSTGGTLNQRRANDCLPSNKAHRLYVRGGGFFAGHTPILGPIPSRGGGPM
jgi:hypothetical protein